MFGGKEVRYNKSSLTVGAVRVENAERGTLQYIKMVSGFPEEKRSRNLRNNGRRTRKEAMK